MLFLKHGLCGRPRAPPLMDNMWGEAPAPDTASRESFRLYMILTAFRSCGLPGCVPRTQASQHAGGVSLYVSSYIYFYFHRFTRACPPTGLKCRSALRYGRLPGHRKSRPCHTPIKPCRSSIYRQRKRCLSDLICGTPVRARVRFFFQQCCFGSPAAAVQEYRNRVLLAANVVS